ncbi:hypothetical protein Hanom_Chr04g00320951 [Helianthus anomalus]
MGHTRADQAPCLSTTPRHPLRFYKIRRRHGPCPVTSSAYKYQTCLPHSSAQFFSFLHYSCGTRRKIQGYPKKTFT